ncbi:MFS transporter permease, partial [Ligilactobacillus animalis]|uniref:MFS transporter permease n=1 Tax=Ligilactobacillus animalis TaxID=1605 RepID=UPI002FDB7810
AITLVKLSENLPGFFDPELAYLTDRETRRLKKATLLNWIQVGIYFVIAFLMLQYQMPLALFIVILLANVVSDSIDGYISNMFIPFSKTWIDHSERRVISALDIVLFSLSIVLGQLLGAAWLTLYPDQFFGLSLLNALTFALGLFFLRKIKFDDTVKTLTAEVRFSIKDFFQKMKLAYGHMRERHLLQMIWLLAIGKATYASFLLLLNVAMVSTSNLRFGSYAQTLAIWQSISFVGLILGAFLRISWLEKINYEQFIMLSNMTIILSVLSCFLGLSLINIMILKLIGTLLSGYMAPKYYTDLIQQINEEQLTRVESLNNFILLLADPVGILQATICLQLFGLRLSWLIELGMLVSFMIGGEIAIYRSKK